MSGDSLPPSEIMPIISGSRLRLNSNPLGESTSSDATALLGVVPVPSETTQQPRVFTRSDEKRREELLARTRHIYHDDDCSAERRTRWSPREENKRDTASRERDGDAVCEPEKGIRRRRDQSPNLYSPPLFCSPLSQDEGAPSHMMGMSTRHSIVRVSSSSSSSSNVSPPPLSSSIAIHSSNVRGATRQEGAATMATSAVGYYLQSRRSSGVGLTEPTPGAGSATLHASYRATSTFSETDDGQRTCNRRRSPIVGVPPDTVHVSSQEEGITAGGCGSCVEGGGTVMTPAPIPLTAEEEEELVELEERYKVFIAEGLRRMHLLAQTMGGNATEQKKAGVGVGLGRVWEGFVGAARSAFGARSLRGGFAKVQQSQPSSDLCTDGDNRAQRQPLVFQQKQNAPASGPRKAATSSHQTLGTTRKDRVLLAVEKTSTWAMLGASLVTCSLCLWFMLAIANSTHAGGTLHRQPCGVGGGQGSRDSDVDGRQFNTTETNAEESCVATGGKLSLDTISSFSWAHALFSALTFAGTFLSRLYGVRAAASNRGPTRSLDKNSPSPMTIISTPVTRSLTSHDVLRSSSVVSNVRRPTVYFWLRQCFFICVFLCGCFFCATLGVLQHQYGTCGGGQPSAAQLSLNVTTGRRGSEVPSPIFFQSVYGWYTFLDVCDINSLFASPSYRMAGLALLSTDAVLTGATFVVLCIGLYSAPFQC